MGEEHHVLSTSTSPSNILLYCVDGAVNVLYGLDRLDILRLQFVAGCEPVEAFEAGGLALFEIHHLCTVGIDVIKKS